MNGMKEASLAERLRVGDGGGFTLADRDPGDTAGLKKDDARERLQDSVGRLRAVQERLYAESRTAVLAVIQGMDAAGKDGIVEHVMAGVNPQGCRVTSFKAPSEAERKHDFLWRCAGALPERGWICIFNRSYYEEVTVVRVHPEFLDKQFLPPERITDAIWAERFDSIRAFERHLVRNGTVVLKFFLHLSRGEQKKRLLARIDEPEKNWKFDPNDVAERQHWDAYMRAYEEAIARTATDEAPWHVVPADHKWFARLAVAEIVADRLEAIDPRFPALDDEKRAALHRVRAQLAAEKDG